MNELLTQLYKQAVELAYQERNDWRYWAELQPVINKRFAELIVEECVEIADRCAENGSWIAGYRIKQHFGVE